MKPESFNLTLEQQFVMRQMQDAADTISRQQALNLLIDASRQLMIKTNIIRELIRKAPLEPMGDYSE